MLSIKDEEITNLIINKDFPSAQILIKHLENSLLNEKAKYTQEILKKRLTNLKKKYFEAIERDEILQVSSKKEIPLIVDIRRMCNKSAEISNKINLKIKPENCDQMIIDNCESVMVEYFVCNEALIIRNCINIEINVTAHQIRLLQSKNITMHVFTNTGIFLEDCDNIIIYKIDSSDEGNKYSEVFDFTNFTRNNYKIMN